MEIKDKITAKNIEKYKKIIAEQISIIESLENQIREESNCCAELPGLQGRLANCDNDLSAERVLADQRLEEVRLCEEKLREAEGALQSAKSPEEIEKAEQEVQAATDAKIKAEDALEVFQQQLSELKQENEQLTQIVASKKGCEEKLNEATEELQRLTQNGKNKNNLLKVENDKIKELEARIQQLIIDKGNLEKNKSDCDKKISRILSKLNISENEKINLHKLFGPISNSNFTSNEQNLKDEQKTEDV
jgi:chromosome segregation ATPase